MVDRLRVSIHARTWRATLTAPLTKRAGHRFNPRPHVAGDQHIIGKLTVSYCVSIHARTWRATDSMARKSALKDLVSIHARTWRATSGTGHCDPCSYLFQSTPARGGRLHTDAVCSRRPQCFNPRPHVAGDNRNRSAHRPLHRCFNPRPHVAGDIYLPTVFNGRIECFNPRPHVAGDPSSITELARISHTPIEKGLPSMA